jgi:methyl-accepting chemotaxis protein
VSTLEQLVGSHRAGTPAVTPPAARRPSAAAAPRHAAKAGAPVVLRAHQIASHIDESASALDQITKAIGAHGAWKHQLKRAIDSGHADVSPETVGADDQCEFGRWLKSRPESERRSEDYRHACQLHTCFHREAGDVLRHALAGRKDEAMRCIAAGGSFTAASEKLTEQMTAWRNHLSHGQATTRPPSRVKSAAPAASGGDSLDNFFAN